MDERKKQIIFKVTIQKGLNDFCCERSPFYFSKKKIQDTKKVKTIFGFKTMPSNP